MPESWDEPVRDRSGEVDAGLRRLVAQARETWAERAGGDPADPDPTNGPGWRPFEDAFPTFYQFTNRPR